MVHLITRISVIGIAITTAALVILIAAFNGIEQMVERLYSDFDAPVTIRSAKGKTFRESTIDLSAIRKTTHVREVSRAVEETVILKHEKKWVNAEMIGIDASFLKTCHIEKHIVDGYPTIEENNRYLAIVGATLLDKLDGFIAEANGYEELTIYTPLREARISRMKSPFKTTTLGVSSRLNYNREVNAKVILVPLEFAQDQLKYDQEITAIYVGIAPGTDPFDVKESLEQKLGKDFIVKTAAEKNELIFKTSQSEKRIVIIILAFVFILAAFNLVASLTMLFIEKKDNISTMQHFGADKSFILKIFLLEGCLIAGRGIIFGLAIGVGVCLTQQFGKFLEMPNTAGEAFPIAFTVQDGLLIIGLVSLLSLLTSFLPVYYLVRRTMR